LLTIVMVATLMVTFIMPVQAHYPGAVIQSQWADKIPTIDGIFGPSEWSDAAVVDLLAADPANELEAYAYFKNNADYLYICVDVPDDTTIDPSDASGFSFDTGHDGVYTAGHDDTFFIMQGATRHFVSNGTDDYTVHCVPFNTTLPLHTGLAGNFGLGPSPNSGAVHRIYEYRIPLALLLASPGDTLGFGMDGSVYWGIYDEETGLGDQWPFFRGEPIYIDEYGDLILATSALPGNRIYLHCEDGLFNLTAPLDTQWHELWPFFCNQYHLSSWNDTSGNGALSHCDWIEMYEKPDGEVKRYHVEEVTITLNVTPGPVAVVNVTGKVTATPSTGGGSREPMYIEHKGGYDPGVLTNPVGTQWHEVYPNFCTSYNLTYWEDNGNSTLDLCDYIELTEIGSENVTWWHVEDVAIDIVVCREPPPVGGEAYPVNKISLLAPWITMGVVLAGGSGWYVLRRRRAQS
jgi:hypothetical protein